MLNLMAIEAPSGPRRAALTDAFNRGYRGQNRETGVCTDKMPAVEAGIARRGRELADADRPQLSQLGCPQGICLPQDVNAARRYRRRNDIVNIFSCQIGNARDREPRRSTCRPTTPRRHGRAASIAGVSVRQRARNHPRLLHRPAAEALLLRHPSVQQRPEATRQVAAGYMCLGSRSWLGGQLRLARSS